MWQLAGFRLKSRDQKETQERSDVQGDYKRPFSRDYYDMYGEFAAIRGIRSVPYVVETAKMRCTGCPGVLNEIKLPAESTKPTTSLQDPETGDVTIKLTESFHANSHRDMKGGHYQMIHTDNVPDDNIPRWPGCKHLMEDFQNRTTVTVLKSAGATDFSNIKGGCPMIFPDTWQDYIESARTLDGWPLTKDSFLFCGRGGVISFETSGQVPMEMAEAAEPELEMNAIELSQKEKNMILALIFAEASIDRGEEVAWKAVAWTLRNRKEDNSGMWPNDYEGVVSQGSQFAYGKDSYNNALAVLEGRPEDIPEGSNSGTPEQIQKKLDKIEKEVMPVLNGTDNHDITGGAEYFNKVPTYDYEAENYDNCDVEGISYDDIEGEEREDQIKKYLDPDGERDSRRQYYRKRKR